MKVSEGKIGRVFVMRLEEGDIIPHCIEEFAAEKSIAVGHVTIVGAIREGQVVVGPRKTDEMPPNPMTLPVNGSHEILATGVIAPTAEGKPVLHIHGALGRSGQTLTGCLREGVSTWHVAEVILYEIEGVDAKRLYDQETGFTLLNVESNQ